MKKYLSIILSLSLILAPSRSQAGDIEGFAGLVVGGAVLVGTGALLATIAGIMGTKKAIARLRAKKLGVSLEVYTAAKMYKLDPVKYREILQMAENHNLDGLREKFTQLNREVFGPDWIQTRNQQFKDFFSMRAFDFTNKYSSYTKKYSRAQYYAALDLWKVYMAANALYFGVVKAFFTSSIWHRMIYSLVGRLWWKDIKKLDERLFGKHLPGVPPIMERREAPSIPIY